MGQVVVEVNGRPYTMNCSDGEEEHLMELAQLLDSEVSAIKRGVGQVGDIRLLLMAGLVVADQVEGLRDARNGMRKQGAEQEDLVAERIEAAAKRLEALASDRAAANAGDNKS
jgi:cell division protein ZapA